MKKLALLGTILWIGIVSPEIFAEPGMGCLSKKDDQCISLEEAQDIFDMILYPDRYENKKDIHIEYKSRILEYIKSKRKAGII